MSLTTLDRVANEIKGTLATAPVATPQQISGYIRTVTDRIRSFSYEFEPRYLVKKITPSRANVNSVKGLLSLNDQLLEVLSITVGGVAFVYGTDIVPEPDEGRSPIKTLRIADVWSGPLRSWYPCNISTPAAYYNSIVITGFFGMRQFYAERGFFDSGITCPAMNDIQPTIVVSAVAGPDPYNRTPMFSPGNLIRIENELIEIVNVDTATKTLTLLRGARGTTKVAHALGTAIRVFEPEEDVVNAVTRQTALLYARRSAFQQITTYPDGISVTFPSDLLAELRATVQRFAYV